MGFEFVRMGSTFADDVEVSDQFVHNAEGFGVDETYARLPWVNPREGKCSGKDNTCEAFSTKKTRNTARPLCQGCSQRKGDDG